ncbi:MAG TPA: vWA domain-containing protein [Pyrinomonadaceae bacterium]|nr:vWA domain-containing protein [Pyrinomonadaceae bacterium]
MKATVTRIAAGLLTFLIGLGVATAWVIGKRHPSIQPVSISETSTAPSSTSLEMVFVLDTTGSMGGLIDGAKQRIWGIVNEVMQQSSHPAVRIGLVAYRDHGDAYVTQVLPLTNDLDKVYSTLMDYRADGGGDEPEDVRQALADGVRKAGWTEGSSRPAQIIFLVGDAPPHQNYTNEPDTLVTAAEAVQQGMIVNTIQCGVSAATSNAWQAIAQRGQGQYFSIAQDGGVAAISSPYDEQLGQLASQLGATYIAYGGGAGEAGEKARKEMSLVMRETEAKVATAAPAAAKADRAYNKVVNTDAYVGDLLQSIENGSLKLDAVKDEDLPADLKKLSPDDRKQEIEKRLAARKDIRAQIVSLSKQRDEFIAAERKKLNRGKESGFDAAVASALKEQLSRKGIK